MWVFSTKGMYSAVETFQDPHMLQIRARDRKDLENLAPYVKKLKIIHTPTRDYEWRIVLSKTKWAAVLSQITTEIDYNNFKDEVKKKQGATRASTYSGVWSVCLEIGGTIGRWSRLGGYDSGKWSGHHDGSFFDDSSANKLGGAKNTYAYGKEPVPEHWHSKKNKKRNHGANSKLFEDTTPRKVQDTVSNEPKSFLHDYGFESTKSDHGECPNCQWPIDDGCMCQWISPSEMEGVNTAE